MRKIKYRKLLLSSLLFCLLNSCATPNLRGETNFTKVNKDTFRVTCQKIERFFSKQDTPDTCWKKNIEIIAKYHGVFDIAGSLDVATDSFLFDDAAIQPLTMKEMIKNLHVYNDEGKLLHLAILRFEKDAVTGDLDTFILRELSEARPLIVGLTNPEWVVGHAYILYGAEYRKEKSLIGLSTDYKIQTVLLFDPLSAHSVTIEDSIFSQQLHSTIAMYVDPEPVDLGLIGIYRRTPSNWQSVTTTPRPVGGGGRGHGRGGGKGGGK